MAGPGDRLSTFQRAQPPQLAAPDLGPALQLQAKQGPERAGVREVAGLGQGHAPRQQRAIPRLRARRPGLVCAGWGRRRGRSAPQGARIVFPEKLVPSRPRLSPELEAGVYFISFFKPLHLLRGSEPRASRATPRGVLREPKLCPRPGQRCALRSFFSC